MMDWLILRHGQSVADIEDRYEGRSDFPLTAAGRDQAERAARWIVESYRFVPEIIIASPLQRARETAVILARRCGLELRLDDGLLEMDCGRIAGLPKAEADRRFPVPRGGFRAYQRRGETGESLLGFRARVEDCWLRLADEAAAAGWERAALVCHGGTINMLFQSFLNLPLTAGTVLATGDTGIHLWRIRDGVGRIVFANYLGHLSPFNIDEGFPEDV